MLATTSPAATRAVLDALAERPGVTAAELAEALDMGRSTVGKALAALEAEGKGVRRAFEGDGGRRQPARWSPAAASDIEGSAAEPAADEAPRQPVAAAPEEAPASGQAVREGCGTPPDRRRLGKGELRGLVLAHLRARSDEELSPGAVAKALGGRSAGAVGNALDRLILDGLVRRTSDRPRRYTAASDSRSQR